LSLQLYDYFFVQYHILGLKGSFVLTFWPFACIFSNFLWGMRYARYQVVHEKAAPERLVLLVHGLLLVTNIPGIHGIMLQE
jgi:hypothetical protein